MSRAPVSRHYIPLGQRAGHLRVHEVGLELSFALDVDDASARAHVAQSEKDAAGLLRHLRGGGESMFSSLTSRHQNKSSAGEDIKNKGNISSWLVCSPRTSGPDGVSFRWICSFPFPFFLQIQGADYSSSCLKSNLT